MDHAGDFLALSSVLVGILATVDSPDAVSNVVDRVAECVAPRGAAGADGDGDLTSSLLTRQSPLGVFIRKFLLAVSRLLFDGISRLFDDVVQYVARFQEDEARARAAAAAAEGDPNPSEAASSDVISDTAESDGGSKDESMEMDDEASSTSASSRQSAEFLWRGDAGDGLLLSPIPARASSVSSPGFAPTAQSSQSSAESRSQPSTSSVTNAPLVSAVATEPLDVSVWTHDQMSYILHDMVRTIERERAGNGNARVDDDLLSEHLRQATETDASNASVLFVKYLDFLHRRDYQGALDSLHQYHDIALSSAKMNAPANSSESGDANGGNPPFSASGSSAGGMHFHGTGIQYAALNLAGLQIVFDHHQAAYESVQEAIRVAQHYGDHVCVAFALSWLIRVYLKLGRSKEQVLGLLGSCIDRAKELRLPSLETLALLAQIESDVLRGPSADRSSSHRDHQAARFLPAVYASRAPSPRPLHIWHRLQETVRSVNAVSSTMSASSGNAGGGGGRGAFGGMQPQLPAAQQSNASLPHEQNESGMRWIKSVDGVLDHMWKLSGKLSLSSAVSWQVLGHRTLGTVFDRIHFLCFQDAASACDIALSVCSLAMCQLGDEDVGDANVYARGLSFLADTIDDVASGELVYHAPIQRKLHSLFFVWALRSGQLLRAKVHSEVLLELSPVHKDLPAHIEALVARALVLSETGDFSESLALLDVVEKTCVDHELTYLHARVLLVTAQVLQGAARAEAPFSALNAALEAVRVCQLQQYDLLLAEAHLVLAEIYVSMGTLDRADALLEEQMPLVMEHGDVNVRGECLLLLAKSALASNGDTRKVSSDSSSSSYKRALDLLQRSSAMFAVSQNLKRLKEISYLRAMVFNHLSIQPFAEGAADKSKHAEMRERAATEFLGLEECAEQAKFKPIEPYFDFEFTDNIRKVISHRMHGG